MKVTIPNVAVEVTDVVPHEEHAIIPLRFSTDAPAVARRYWVKTTACAHKPYTMEGIADAIRLAVSMAMRAR